MFELFGQTATRPHRVAVSFLSATLVAASLTQGTSGQDRTKQCPRS